MSKLFNEVLNYLEKFELRYEKFEDDEVVLIPNIGGSNGSWNCVLYVADECKVIIRSMFNGKVQGKRVKEMMEYVIRSNDNLMIGNWDIDLDNGSITYKTSAIFDEKLDSKSIDLFLHSLFGINIVTFDRHIPFIMEIIYGKLSAKKAIQKYNVHMVQDIEKKLSENLKGELEDLMESLINKGN
ncbi:MAG: hypothetical protein ABRQ37_25815 [Candidatus Eremiobacterota bacterium]